MHFLPGESNQRFFRCVHTAFLAGLTRMLRFCRHRTTRCVLNFSIRCGFSSFVSSILNFEFSYFGSHLDYFRLWAHAFKGTHLRYRGRFRVVFNRNYPRNGLHSMRMTKWEAHPAYMSLFKMSRRSCRRNGANSGPDFRTF